MKKRATKKTVQSKSPVAEPKPKPNQVFNPAATLPTIQQNDWVNLEVSLIYWKFMNFQVPTKTSCQLQNIACE